MLLLLVLSFLLATEAKRITPELIMTLQLVQEAQISPDGQQVAFTLNRPRAADESPGADWQEIWMMYINEGKLKCFTAASRNARSPRWSPDGKTLAFISDRGKGNKEQIYLIPTDGGEGKAITNFENDVDSLAWSPDGKFIAFTMKDLPSKEEQEAQKAGRDWQVVDEKYLFRRVYVLELSTGKHWQVTKEPLNVWEYGWAPNSKQLLIFASSTTYVDDQYMAGKLYTVSASEGSAKLLIQTEGKLESPIWSPDGKYVAWRGASKLSDPDSGCIFITEVGSGKAQNLTTNYEGSVTFIRWADDSKSIFFGAIERQDTVIRRLDLTSGKISEPMLKGLIFNSPASFASDNKYVLIASTAKHPPELFFVEGSKARRLTHLNPQFDDVALGQQEIVKWKSYDGLEIEGILIKPVGYEPGRRYPLFVQYHGGPESADTNGWYATTTRWGQMLASHGIAVLYPNYRGSIGRGVAFAEANQGDMMGKEFDDALAGIDYLIKTGLVDADRVALGGGSYGGYAAAWAATRHSHRFKLAVVWMGGTNRVSKVGTADNYKEESIVHWKAEPYENYELYWDRSPIKYIKQAQTPTLILHGEKDQRVPVSQGKELYTALKWKGVPVEFVIYPREGHGIRERAHQLDFLQRILAHSLKYLSVQH
ncbi:MAG: S9 family peptidase [Acidobacteriota bacterium]|nr:S9 family peptidase [Blastocatellia bacterium]MDW8413527.1 S9 family peptidase [Acidobacteriota bacterium]